MGDPLFPKAFAAAGRPGAYLGVVREGQITGGDCIEVIGRPAHAVTSALVSRALLREPERLPVALEASALPDDLREWMRHRVGRRRSGDSG